MHPLIDDFYMTLTTNANFTRLLEELRKMGPAASAKTSDTEIYRAFIDAFPLPSLPTLTAAQYCIGTGDNDSFCYWVERGLESVLGRYMPGTSRGHIVYFRKDGTGLYKNRHLADLSDEDALRYTLKVQATIAAADPKGDITWIDEDNEIYRRAEIEPRVTIGEGRKLRLLACYHPEDVLPISSSAHLGHFLEVFGYPDSQIPEARKPVARMRVLWAYYEMARSQIPGLSPYGFMKALYSDGVGIRPVKADADIDNDPDDDAPAPAYLLTWNPEHFKLGGDAGVVQGAEQTWTCHSKQPNLGDTVYLIRVGQEPRGIVARGTVTRESFEDKHWKDESKAARYIAFRVEEYRPSAEAGLLPMVLLNAAMPKQKWSPQSSGIGIDASVEPTLRALWDSGKDRHGLRQYVDWATSDPAARRDDWLTPYRTIVARAKAIQENPSDPIGEDVLDELWRVPSNGVTGVGPGALSTKEFEDNRRLLAETTREISNDPSVTTLRKVEERWQAAVKAKSFSKVNRAVIRRVFAAVSPDRYTSLLRDGDCQKLLALLQKQFELKVEASAGGDWAGLNADIVICMRKAGLDAASTIENNTAMWHLVGVPSPGEGGEVPVVSEPLASYRGSVVAPAAAPRNLILYGPPGTGKTYQTVNEAIAILAPQLLEGEPSRMQLKAAFDGFIESGQIVFCTFHQSFSYEDFVEGIRATAKNGKLEYTVEAGLFKRLCERADQGQVASEDPFDRALTMLLAQQEDAGGRLEMSTDRGKRFYATYDGGDTFRVFPVSSTDLNSGYVASMKKVRNFYTGDTTPTYNESYVRGMLAYLRKQCGLPESGKSGLEQGKKQPFVLVIDEINRGNVSRIFGELITLIEPSKRAGMAEGLAIALPYSKDLFSVPANLHIIGTMNTADRSLAGIDIALRRRFDFKELPPRPDLLDEVVVKDVSVGALLRVMNERIELLLDRDHCIGHANFMCLPELPEDERLSELGRVFRHNVVPLLQEYFFEDWQRIQWVLNDHEKDGPFQFVRQSGSAIDRLFGTAVAVNEVNRRWEINESAFDSIEAYSGIIDASTAKA